MKTKVLSLLFLIGLIPAIFLVSFVAAEIVTVNLDLGGASIDSVVLKLEWQRNGTVNNARLKIYNGTTWVTYTLTLPPAGTDYIETVDLKALDIDTANEVNALKIWFQATDGSGAYTWHDWVEVQVTYIELPSMTTKTVNLNPDKGKDTTGTSYTLTSADLDKLKTSNDARYRSKYAWAYSYSDSKYIEFEFPDITPMPNVSEDWTDTPYALNSADLAKLSASDDDRYQSRYTWASSYSDLEYIEFEFGDITIPSGAAIDSVVLKFEWQRTGTIEDARLKIYNGTTWVTYTLTLPPAGTDYIETVDLKALGIDTEAEINALKMWFQANCVGDYTWHDWVKVEVKYSTPQPTADVTFTQLGVGTDFTGAVLTVDGVGYDVTVLPKTFTWVVGSEHAFEYHSPLVVDAGKQYVWTHTTGLSTAQSGTIMVLSGGGSVTGHYKIQYLATFSQTGLSAEASGTVVTVDGVPKTLVDLPYSLWVDENSVVTFSYEAIVSSIISGQQFRLDSVTGPMSPISVTASTTVTGNYVVQYSITFDQTGLDNTAVGTIVTVDSLELQFEDLPYGIWVDKNSIVTYSYSSTVPSTSTGKQFRLVDVTGLVSPITITNTVTVTGNYKAQFEIAFNQSGVGLDFAGTVVTIDGVEYTVSMLPFSFWWNEDSIHTFSFSSPLIVDAGKQYVWVSTSGLSTLQSGTLTITGSGSVTGNYVVQVKYQITFSQTGVDSDFTGTIVVIDGVDYKFTDLPVSFMWDAGSIHTFSFQSPLVVAVNAKQYVWTSTTGLSTQQSESITVSTSGSVTGNYKTQYYLTVSSPYGSPVPTTGWFDAGTITASVISPWPGPAGTRYVCTGWTGTGSVSPSGTETSVTFTISEPSSITWNWKTQHLLTVLTDPPGLSPQPTRNPTGEAGPANGWWYDATTRVTLTAQTVPEYTFNYWDVDGASQGSGVNPIPVDMDAQHTATAHYSLAPPSVSISPPSASIRVGQSVAFNSTASGGKPPYRYQWYLNGTPVSGATSSSWTFTSATTGTYLIYLTVTDQNDNTAQSATSTVKVGPAPPVGGYTISFAKNVPTSQTAAYTTLIALFGGVLILTKRKRK